MVLISILEAGVHVLAIDEWELLMKSVSYSKTYFYNFLFH